MLTRRGANRKYFNYSPVAQSVEQLAVNQLVGGSSPSRGASLDQKQKAFDNVEWPFACAALGFAEEPASPPQHEEACLAELTRAGNFKIFEFT